MRLILLFLFLSTLLSVNIVAATQVTPPVTKAPSLPTTQNNHDLVYQQLFSMHSQLASLDEKLQQQKTLGNDVKALEAAQQALTIQLSRFQAQLEAQDKLQASQFTGFDGRISDIASNTNMWGVAFTIFGLIITVAAIALGFSAKNRAVYEAKLAANTASDSHMLQWLEDNKGKLISETKVELEQVSLELKDRAEKLAAEARAALSKIEHDLIEESKRIVTSNKGEANKGLNKHNKPPTGASAKSWFKVGLSAFENNEYDDALKAWAKVLELLDQKEEPELYAITLTNQGITYGQQDKPDDELNSYATLIEQYKDSSNEEILIQVAKAMGNQGIRYGQQGKYNDSLNSCTTLIKQFKDSSNEEIQIQVAKAMYNQGVTYGQQGKLEGELSSYVTLIKKFKDAPNEEVQIQVAMAMCNQGVAYGQQGKLDDELSSYATLIEQFKGSANEEIQIQVAKAMAHQGITYGQQDKPDDELNSYATLIEQFKGSSNEEIQIQVAKAMCNQGATYGEQGKLEDALNSFITLIEQFKDSSNEEIQKTIANSRANMAELALLYETPEQVLCRVTEVEEFITDQQVLAVMQFIRFLLDDKTIEEVLSALAEIPTEMKLTWGFSEIKDYLTTNFEGEKLQQVQAIVSFFEQHKDIEKLRIELGLKS
ncbi:tetratricopeptide repeat protein [Pseudoalteromonas fuliginea]|uniref:tetratricopeptide repeat protein n=1 Tax=Pseudoalteromonas fuliginea TaxID=1872678 RepID=UPI00317E785B